MRSGLCFAVGTVHTSVSFPDRGICVDLGVGVALEKISYFLNVIILERSLPPMPKMSQILPLYLLKISVTSTV